MTNQELAIGTTLRQGSYRIEKVLGRGGFGITYLAVHTMLEKQVAIKEFFPKDYCDRDNDTNHLLIGTSSNTVVVEKLRSKFIKEARNIAKLRHPNIVSIQDIFEENDTAYYVMDFIEGESLKGIIDTKGPVEENLAIDYIRKISSALAYMHSLNMNHLDIKPSNIMIQHINNEPILIDFGTSKQYDGEGEQTSTMAPGFTHGYAPMEQYKPGGVATFTPQTDIYALGATLYTLLKGTKPPHYSEIFEEGLPELPSIISDNTKKAITHAMELRKVNRPASIELWLDELEPLKGESPSPKIDVSPTPTPKADVDSSKDSDATVFNDTPEPIDIPPKPIITLSKPVIDDSINNSYKSLEGICDNHEWVDLGLPSGNLWSKSNVGINNIGTWNFYSIYFAWGESSPKIDYKRLNYKINHYLTPMKINPELWGIEWSVPSIQDFKELINLCSWEWIYVDMFDAKIYGYKVIGPNNKFIFLPAYGMRYENAREGYMEMGFYWTSECNISNHPCYLEFEKSLNNKKAVISNILGGYNGMCYRLVLKQKI